MPPDTIFCYTREKGEAEGPLAAITAARIVRTHTPAIIAWLEGEKGPPKTPLDVPEATVSATSITTSATGEVEVMLEVRLK